MAVHHLHARSPAAREDSAVATSAEQTIAIAHDARQKLCAAVIEASLIVRLLPSDSADREIVQRLVARITALSKMTDSKLAEIQSIALADLDICDASRRRNWSRFS